MLEKQARIFGLDVLRALAILLVVVSHATFLLFDENIPLVVTVIRTLGAVGVDLFFVLSGYLIGGILYNKVVLSEFKLDDLFKFWKRRWYRTLPVYFVTLVLNILLLLILGDFQIGSKVWFYMVFLQNFSGAHPDFFTEAWSLSIEEYAYIFLPLIFFLALYLFKLKNKRRVYLVTTLLIIVVLALFKWQFYISSTIESYSEWSAAFRKVLIYRLDSVYYGFLLLYITKVYASLIHKFKTVLFVIGVVLFLSLHMAIFLLEIEPNTHLWFYTFIYLQGVCISLVLLFPCCISLNSNKVKLKEIVYFMSTRSYSIYLLNYSLILLSIKRLIQLNTLSFEERMLVVICFLIITLFTANILYTHLEKPILQFRDRKISR
ncbi:acyltransferase family protein [Seonamhaeicola marinus]|uniref:Acyltransferase n=1 Tax=Seonamhaeicola marinus TaxID=1912246 RepID=A0A5D0JH53_9FLAO|nr:acyltransferase [Seonamhaeicola marinus]TYA94771.1 acyltransferase [Seonamhaeicola marinus]